MHASSRPGKGYFFGGNKVIRSLAAAGNQVMLQTDSQAWRETHPSREEGNVRV